jgi:hypothetical protein
MHPRVATHPTPDLTTGGLSLVNGALLYFLLPTSRWTLEGLAKVCAGQRLTPQGVSDETLRQAIRKLGVQWKRAESASPSERSARTATGAPATRREGCGSRWPGCAAT